MLSHGSPPIWSHASRTICFRISVPPLPPPMYPPLPHPTPPTPPDPLPHPLPHPLPPPLPPALPPPPLLDTHVPYASTGSEGGLRSEDRLWEATAGELLAVTLIYTLIYYTFIYQNYQSIHTCVTQVKRRMNIICCQRMRSDNGCATRYGVPTHASGQVQEMHRRELSLIAASYI